MDGGVGDSLGECPLCEQKFDKDKLEGHVNMCLFLRESSKSPASSLKRKNFSIFGQPKRVKQEVNNNNRSRQDELEIVLGSDSDTEQGPSAKIDACRTSFDAKPKDPAKTDKSKDSDIPLAERMRPDSLDNYIGQAHIMNKNAVLRQVIERHEIPSMILWGPPGCGKVRQSDYLPT